MEMKHFDGAGIIAWAVMTPSPEIALEILREWCSWKGISYGRTPEEESDLDTDVEECIGAIIRHEAKALLETTGVS